MSDVPLLLSSIWTLTVFPLAFLILRLYAKISRGRPLWWDDGILILSFVALFGSTLILSVGVLYGVGLHYDEMDPDAMPTQAKMSYSAAFCVILSAAWSKTSFAVTLLRMAEGRMKFLVWIIIISVNTVLSVSAALLWTSCWPTAKLFDPTVPGKCWTSMIGQNYQTFASAYSGTMDIVLALMPWHFLQKATLSRGEKIGAAIAMGAGTASGIITFLKIFFLPQITDEDSTTVELKIYGTAEPGVAIVAASIPVLRAFLRVRHRESLTPLVPVSSPLASPRSTWEHEK